MRPASRALALVGPALALVGVFFGALAAVLAWSVSGPRGVGWSIVPYAAFVADPYHLAYLGRSLWIATYATAVCLALGYPVAYAMSRGSRRFAVVATLTLAIQFFSIYVIKMYGWMLILGKNGVVNRLLLASGLVERPLSLMYNELGVAIGLVASSLPLMVFPINTTLQAVSLRIEEAATGLGGNRWQVFRHVTLPLSTPGVVAGVILTFVFNFTAYLTPALLGGGFFKMIGNLIFDEATLFNYPFAAAAAVITLGVSLVAIFGVNAASQRLFREARR